MCSEWPIYAIEPMGVSTAYYQQLEVDAERNAGEAVETTAAELRRTYPSLVKGLSTSVVRGTPADAIIAEAEEWKAHYPRLPRIWLFQTRSSGFGL